MSPGVEELPTGQQPHRRQPRRVRRIDFAELDGLSTSADQELNATEDTLVAFLEQQAKRDELYVGRGLNSSGSTSSAGWAAWHDWSRDRAADRGPGARLSPGSSRRGRRRRGGPRRRDRRSQGTPQEDHERRGLARRRARALAGLRQRHTDIAARVPSIKIAYDRAVKTIEDPAARVAELTSKFGGLQQ